MGVNSTYLYDNTKDEFKHLIGKRIKFTTDDGREIVGTAEFIGYNEYLKRDQVTVNRCPFTINNYNTIKHEPSKF